MEERQKNIPSKCYCLMIVLCFGIIIGIYFLVQPQIDPQSTEISEFGPVLEAWSAELPAFSLLSVSINSTSSSPYNLSPNTTDPWSIDIENFPNYPHLFYSNYAILINSTDPNRIILNPQEYNVTTDLTIQISYNGDQVFSEIKDVVVHSRIRYPVNAKVCRNSGRGFWNASLDTCYYHFNTDKVCFVVGKDMKVVDWYRSGCDSKGYVGQTAVIWQKADEFTNFSYPIFVEIRSDSDPFVYASYNNLVSFSPSSQEYKTIGITLITICSAITLVPAIYIFIIRKKKKYVEMSGESRV